MDHHSVRGMFDQAAVLILTFSERIFCKLFLGHIAGNAQQPDHLFILELRRDVHFHDQNLPGLCVHVQTQGTQGFPL